MAYEPKPNSGTLWTNEYKKQDNHPDWKGDVHIDPDLLNSLMIKNPNGLVKIAISGWNKTINGKNVVSLAAAEPYVKPEEDLPY